MKFAWNEEKKRSFDAVQLCYPKLTGNNGFIYIYKSIINSAI